MGDKMDAQSIKIQEGTGPLVDALPFSDGEYQRRLAAIRSAMSRRELDAFVSFTPENIYYVTGHDTPGYYFYQACVVTHAQRPVNVLRRIETTNTLGRSWSRLTVGYEDREDPIAATLGLLREVGAANRKIGAEATSWFIGPQRYIQLQDGIKQAGGQLVDASGTVEELRVIKGPEELAYIRAGARICERGMRAGVEASREGTNENEVAAAIIAELVRSGGEYAGLPPFITSGPRSSLCHATWAGRRFGSGDVLAYELPGVVKRYAAALFRIGVVGPPDEEVKRRAAASIEALESVIAAMKPGVTSDAVHRVTRGVFEKYGYAHLFGHRTGYSVGINYPPDWGEGHIMSIWAGDERPLRTGMTFHLVPGLFDLGKHLINISETVLVTETGCEPLTHFPRELFVV
jgi:Xaa-Pro dipeptidase